MSLPVSVLDALSLLAGELPSSSIADLARALEMLHVDTVRAADLNLSGSVPPVQHASVWQLVEAWKLHSPNVSGSLLAAALVSMSFYDTRLRRELQVEAVWTGPRVGAAGLRRTEQVLLEMIATARASIWLVAFAAYKVPQVSIALQVAIERGVRLRLVLEDRDISEGKVAFDPLTALAAAGLGRAEIFVWPVAQRLRDGRGRHGSLHAKGLVVDDQMVFITSANMTEDALNINMELGVALHVPAAARQIADHLRGLVSQGILVARET